MLRVHHFSSCFPYLHGQNQIFRSITLGFAECFLNPSRYQKARTRMLHHQLRRLFLTMHLGDMGVHVDIRNYASLQCLKHLLVGLFFQDTACCRGRSLKTCMELHRRVDGVIRGIRLIRLRNLLNRGQVLLVYLSQRGLYCCPFYFYCCLHRIRAVFLHRRIGLDFFLFFFRVFFEPYPAWVEQ